MAAVLSFGVASAQPVQPAQPAQPRIAVLRSGDMGSYQAVAEHLMREVDGRIQIHEIGVIMKILYLNFIKLPIIQNYTF